MQMNLRVWPVYNPLWLIDYLCIVAKNYIPYKRDALVKMQTRGLIMKSPNTSGLVRIYHYQSLYIAPSLGNTRFFLTGSATSTS